MSVREYLRRGLELAEETPKDVSEDFVQLIEAGLPLLGVTLEMRGEEEAVGELKGLLEQLCPKRPNAQDIIELALDHNRPINELARDEFLLLVAAELTRRVGKVRGVK